MTMVTVVPRALILVSTALNSGLAPAWPCAYEGTHARGHPTPGQNRTPGPHIRLLQTARRVAAAHHGAGAFALLAPLRVLAVFRIWVWLRRGISVDFQGGVVYGIVRVAHTNRATPAAGIGSAETPSPRYPTGRFVRSAPCTCGKSNDTTKGKENKAGPSLQGFV